MLWNYKTFHFSPKMRQMRYPDCKTTLNTLEEWKFALSHLGPMHKRVRLGLKLVWTTRNLFLQEKIVAFVFILAF